MKFSKQPHQYTRLSAALIHAGFSVFVFILFFVILIKFWYPAPYFSASGGWQGLKIVAFVDVILGPLLTFCVFNPKKSVKLLMMDLGVIFTLQLCALVWGIHTVYQQRPVAIVFWENRFYTVPAKVLSEQNYDLKQLHEFSDATPPLIYAEKPAAKKELVKIIEIMKDNQWVPYQQPHLYKAYKQHFHDIFQYQVDINAIISNNAEMKQELDLLLLKLNRSIDDNAYIKLESRYRNIILVFSKTGEPLGYISAPYKKYI